MKRYIQSSSMFSFRYSGPVWRVSIDSEPVLRNWTATTQAMSAPRALANLAYAAKQRLHLSRYAKMVLDPECLIVEPSSTTSPIRPVYRCSKCGRTLNDAGECLVCDLAVDDAEDY